MTTRQHPSSVQVLSKMIRKEYMFLSLLVLSSSCVLSALAQKNSNKPYKEYFKLPYEGKPYRLYTSTYDYSKIAAEMTAGCTDDYSKVRSIYDWICDNIDYDFTDKIHRADSCYMAGRGVCQAYCELFYRLAEASNVKVEVISGLSKDEKGYVNPRGHTWLFAYTRENHGFLLDPTWGAGLNIDGKYRKNPDRWSWFNVNPEWMLLTHLPDDAHYQLIDSPVTADEFRAMPYVNPLYRTYGISEHTLFQRAREQKLSMPTFYNMGEGIFSIVDIPLVSSLKIGQKYTFRIKMNNEREFAVINNPVLCSKQEWKNEGNGIYSLEFMPRVKSKVNFSLKDPQVAQRWNKMVEYSIEEPTAADWAIVEQHYPLCVPDVAAVVGGRDMKGWSLAGIDDYRLLKLIREQKVKELPGIYYDKGQRLEIISVPMNRRLKRGQKYTFSFRPKSGVQWAIVANRQKWYKDWAISKDGIYTVSITPERKGTLELFVMLHEGEEYWTCLAYDVE